ncbi:MAG: Rpn family recombination-promoting nuclease/putative transposase [Myxococcota bacterium]
MPSSHDTYARISLTHPEVVSDLVRLAFPTEVAASLDFETLRTIDRRLGDERLRGAIETDFLFEITTRAGDPVLLYVLLEHQSTIDHWMAYRMLRYRVRVWETYRAEHPRSPLAPVLPLVLYHGERPWSAPLEVDELATELDDDTAISARYRIIDISGWSDEHILALALGAFTRLTILALANSRREVTLESRLEAWGELIQSLVGFSEGFEAVRRMIVYWMNVGQVADLGRAREIARALSPKLEEVMPSFAEQMREEGRLEGHARGRTEGVERGRTDERRAILGKLLRAKFGELSEDSTQRIEAAEPNELEAWLERVLVAESADEVFRG